MRQTAETSDALSPKSEPDAAAASDDLPLTVIEPGAGWRPIHLAELWRCRELIYFLAWRDVKVRYKQTLLGAAWAVLQPILMMVVFTLVFERMAHVASGATPYPLFAYTGLAAWSFFATATANAAQSVVGAERLITKIYFPRLAIPLAAVAAALVDFFMACMVLLPLMIYYHQRLAWAAILAPLAIVLLTLSAFGFGVALSALNVAYRDVRYVVPFLMQLWLFATPSVYIDRTAAEREPAMLTKTSVADRTGMPAREDAPVRRRVDWLAINPLDGLIAFFRASLLGLPLPWRRLAYPAAAIPCIALAGCYYFRRVEDSFADLI